MTARQRAAEGFRLVVPLDASGVEDFRPEQAIKVAARDRKGTVSAQTVRLDASGRGTAAFAFPERPGSLRVAIGPETASDEELFALQTITLNVPARSWEVAREVTLPPVRIPSFYWHWWPRWCRTFTVRGRVHCPDGSPVPGARVCAYDVDWWWWWSSTQLVGCATTDASGAFEIKFRWCCGFWPWWWWRLRAWRLEPKLVELIAPALQQLRLPRLPAPSPKPSLAVFREVLAEGGVLTRAPEAEVRPDLLDDLRRRLLERLPRAPELERLHVWPWWPWYPWWDCNPDLIFRVTQECRGQETVILDEGFFDARWNVPTLLDVTLVAGREACCITDDGDPEGNCMVISSVCDDLVATIGGNPGAPAAPAGYRNPGVAATYGDRPYAGVVPIAGQFGSAAAVDYYEFEWSDDGGATWNSMPPAAAGGFTRTYWGPQLGGGPVGFHAVPFGFTTISGRNVIASRPHFEASNDPLSWGVSRFWVANRDLLMQWLTENNFADGTYQLRVLGWTLSGGNLVNPRVLPLCDTEQENRLVLTLDNRLVGPGSGHVPPTTPGHRCGPDTVHVCTLEPDTDFIAVRINGAPVEACATVDAKAGGTLEIDFLAHDPDGHLAYYTLQATYEENLVVDLLGLVAGGLATLTPLGGAAVPPAAQVGPTYGQALAQGAAGPTWAGGAVRLTIPDLRNAFKQTCCYQLELRAYKRTIASCDEGYPHRNLSEYTLTVIV